MTQAILKTDILYEELNREFGNYAPGDQFLTSREIMRRYQVSQLVVDRTLARFRESGMLRSVRGRGLFVTEEVNRVKKTATPCYMLAAPHWPSSDLTLVADYFEEIAPKYAPIRLVYHRYDYAETIPADLPLEEENVRGLAILPSSEYFDAETFHRLENYASRLPLVILGRHLGEFGFLSVNTDDQCAGNLAVNHLRQCGHRHIAVLLSEPHNSVIMDRLRAIQNCAQILNMECDVIDCEVSCGEFAPDKAYRTFEKVIRRGFEFTGLIGIATDSVIGAVNACHNLNIPIPERLSIVSIGSQHSSVICHPPLDLICTDLEEQIDAVLEVLAHPDKYHVSNNPLEYIKPRLVRRESTRDLN